MALYRYAAVVKSILYASSVLVGLMETVAMDFVLSSSNSEGGGKYIHLQRISRMDDSSSLTKISTL